MSLKVGDAVRYGTPNGSVGLIEQENHYGSVYVRWYYGKDVKGEYITALSSVPWSKLERISMQELNAVRNRMPDQGTDFMTRLHEQNASRGKRWHPSGLVSWSLSDWFTAMAGEVGELGNIVKKLNRARDGLKGNKETPEQLRVMLGKEAADILIYLELFCQVAGIDLVQATREKFNEVSERNGFPERL